jgi:hypothetical protein
VHLRPFLNDDLPEVIAVFRDAMLNITSQDYDADQLRVWAQHADEVEAFRRRLSAGLSVVAADVWGWWPSVNSIRPITSIICTVGSAVGAKGVRRAF